MQKENNLPSAGWVLVFDRNHPKKDEVVKWLCEMFPKEGLTGHCPYYDSHGECYIYEEDLLSPEYPRLTMDDFLALTVDWKGVPKVGDMVEASNYESFKNCATCVLLYVLPENHFCGVGARYIVGFPKNWAAYQFIRPVPAPLSLTPSEAIEIIKTLDQYKDKNVRIV